MRLSLCFLVAMMLAAVAPYAGAAGHGRTVHGYVLDSACAFTKNLKKPVSVDCAVSCAKAGSPLVILADNGVVYWPISDAMPAQGQNDRLMEFAGKRVVVTGKVYDRAGSQAIVISNIQAER
jgi:hypothetical protein